MITLAQATDWIRRHEGFLGKAYRDSRGFLTIGYGTNLDAPAAASQCAAVGLDYQALRDGQVISTNQGDMLLDPASQHAIDLVCVRVKGISMMPDAVQLAMTDMAYNLGGTGFCEFSNTLAAVERRDWRAAAAGMEDSLWFHQVGTRAQDDIALVLSAEQVSA